jgi:short-subunit dehydrogenase
MGAYNASKHAVVSVSEMLSHALALVTDRIRCSVLCAAFVSTGISKSESVRPADQKETVPSKA